MVVSVHSYLFKIVVFSTDTQTLLRVGHSTALGRGISEDDILELVHAGIGEHQRRIILDDHRRGGHYLVALLPEKLLE